MCRVLFVMEKSDTPKTQKISPDKKKPALRRADKPSDSRRDFMRIAGVAAAGAVLAKPASGLTIAPNLAAQWLELVALGDTGPCYVMSNNLCCDCAASDFYDIGIGSQQQDQSNWCWIAVGLAVGNYLGGSHVSPSESQCSFMSNWLTFSPNSNYVGFQGNDPSCCGYYPNSPTIPYYCNQTGDIYLLLLNWIGVVNPTQGGARPIFTDIMAQLDANQPVVIALDSSDGGTHHFALITGYGCINNIGSIWVDGYAMSTVNISDPMWGEWAVFPYCWIDYLYQYLSGDGNVTWDGTIFTAAPPSSP